MKKIIIFFSLALIALAGCEQRLDQGKPRGQDGDASSQQEEESKSDSQQSEDDAVQAKPGQVVTFELPDGWIRDEDSAPDRAIRWSPSSDGVKPYVLASASAGTLKTKGEARQYAQKDHAERMQHCDNEQCAKWITYSERKIADVDVFISTDVNFYWGADSLSSILWFEKDGVSYRLDFDDPVEDHLEAVGKIVETIRTVKE